MSIDERLHLYEMVSRISKKYQCQFAVGVSATTLHDAVLLARKGHEVGCNGIMLGLPPYLRLCQEEILEYVEVVRNAVPRDIPILLYNNVMRNSYGATPETVVNLHQRGIIWGVKHASVNFHEDCKKIFELDPSIRLYTGSDIMTKELMISSPTHQFYGVTSILGNIFPSALAKMVADFVYHSPGQNIGAANEGKTATTP